MVGQNMQMLKRQFPCQDLGPKDMERSKILLVCRLVRLGPLESKEASLPRRKKNLQPSSGSPTGHAAHAVRQPYGMAVADVTELFRVSEFSSDSADERQWFMPILYALVCFDFIDSEWLMFHFGRLVTAFVCFCLESLGDLIMNIVH